MMAVLLAVSVILIGVSLAIRGRQARPTFAFDNTSQQVAFSPDGRTLISGGPKFEYMPSSDPWALPDDLMWLAYVKLRDIRSGATLVDHSLGTMKLDPQRAAYPIQRLAFSSDGGLLVAGNWDPQGMPGDRPVLRIWDAATGVEGPTLDLPNSVDHVVFGEGGQSLMVNWSEGFDQERIQRWETRTWQPLPAIVLKDASRDLSAFAPDGSAIALLDARGATVTLFDLPSGLKRAVLSDPVRTGKQRSYADLRFSPDGQTLAVLCNDNAVQLWDVPSSRLRSTIPQEFDEATRVSALACGDRYLAIGVNVTTFPSLLDRWIDSVSPNWLRTAATSEVTSRVQVYDGLTGRWISTLPVVQPYLGHIAISPDGQTVATTGMDGPTSFGQSAPPQTTMIWDVSSGR